MNDLLVRTRGLTDEKTKKPDNPNKKRDFRKNDGKKLDWGASSSDENKAFEKLKSLLLNPLSLHPADFKAKKAESGVVISIVLKIRIKFQLYK